MIREINEGEFEVFFRLMAEVEAGSHFDGGNPRHIEWLKRRIAAHFLRGTRFFGYYLEDGTPVGFAGLLINEGPDGISGCWRSAELLDLALFSECRGKGYGSELLKHAEDYAREAGVYCLFMVTYAAEYGTIAFYGKNGFTPVATLPDVQGPGAEGEVYMRKILTKEG